MGCQNAKEDPNRLPNEDRLVQEANRVMKLEEDSVKLLLLGTGGSGKTT